MANANLIQLTTSTTIPTPTQTAFPFQSLDCYRCARELALRVHRAAISDPELRDQASRAAKSAFLNLAEGLPDDRAGMRRKYFLASDGSLHEVVAAVDLACAIGAVGTDDAACGSGRIMARAPERTRAPLRAGGQRKGRTGAIWAASFSAEIAGRRHWPRSHT
jgi:four helix bundle protein